MGLSDDAAFTLVRQKPASPAILTSGDTISGIVRVDVARAEQLETTAITVTLRGKAIIKCGRGNRRRTQIEQLLSVPLTLWRFGQPLYPNQAGIVELPWSFQMPSGALPPSFTIGNTITGRDAQGASVFYYIHLKGSRKGLFTIAARVNSAFAFLPSHVMSQVPDGLSHWQGEWDTVKRSKKVRKRMMGDTGSVDVELMLPQLENVPLFTPIPYRLHVRSTSRQVTKDLTKFDFPRNPSPSEVSLKLRQYCHLRALGEQQVMSSSSSSLGGLGEPPLPTDKSGSVEMVDVQTTGPDWLPTEKDQTTGRWTEDTTISGTVTLRCQPTFTTTSSSIVYQAFLDLTVKIPGVSSDIDIVIGPLRLHAPTRSPQLNYRAAMPGDPTTPLPKTPTSPYGAPAPPAFATLDLPPSYWDAVDTVDEKGD